MLTAKKDPKMKTLFEETEGKYGEDLTTAIFKYCCSTDEFRQFINSKLIRIDQNTIINDQKRIKNGRFDLLIENTDEYYIIENKFFASFTNVNNKHQLKRYYDWLLASDYSKRELIVLTIKRRKKEVEEFFDQLNADNRIATRILLWEDIVVFCKGAENIVLKELAYFVDRKYLKEINIEEEKIMKLFDKEIATTYNDLIKMINKIHDLLKDELSNVGNLKNDEKVSYGFYFHKEKKEYWIGFDPSFWVKTGIPIDFQYRADKVNEPNSIFEPIEGFYGFHYRFKTSELTSDSNLYSAINRII